MKLRDLNESVSKIILKATVTQAETFTKVLDIEDLAKLQTHLEKKSEYKPKMVGATIDVISQLLKQPIDKIKMEILDFINNSLTLDIFTNKYEKQLTALKISPLEWN